MVDPISILKDAGIHVYPMNKGLVPTLRTSGTQTIKAYEKDELFMLRSEFMATMRAFPEFEQSATHYVVGGFAALGNPSSFHNPLVRKLRLRAHQVIVPLLQELHHDMHVEQLHDRMMWRQAGQMPTRETWHRDICPNAAQTDIIYGGWLNLNDEEQIFSYVPGSHVYNVENSGVSGFARITDLSASLNKCRHKMKVPPGHIVIFPQFIVHEVSASKKKYDMYRLFLGWRVTSATTPLYSDTLERIKKQAPMKLPGGMEPSMYASNHLKYHSRLVKAVSEHVKPITLDESGYVHKVMYSLEKYGFDLYPEYTLEELVMHNIL